MLSDAIDERWGGGWNYRVRTYLAPQGIPGIMPEPEFDIIEVYYDRHGNITAWAFTTGPTGETADELRRDLEAMLHALDQPVLTPDELPGERAGRAPS